jgi:hypothetical protein
MSFKGLIVVLLTVLIQCSFGEKVESIVARLSAPVTDDDYMTGSYGTYGTGDTVTVDSLSTIIYFCAIYNSVELGHLTNIEVKGLNSKEIKESSDLEATQSLDSIQRCFETNMNTFSTDTSIKATAVIKDETGNVLFKKSIAFTLEVEATADETSEASIVSFIARKSVPTTTDLYDPGSEGAIDDWDYFMNLTSKVYFAQKFTNLMNGYKIELIMTGLSSGEVESHSQYVTSFYATLQFYYETTISDFGAYNDNIKAELNIYNLDNIIVASDSLEFEYLVDSWFKIGPCLF